jgi:DNA-binding MarR family transcriptional regulator
MDAPPIRLGGRLIGVPRALDGAEDALKHDPLLFWRWSSSVDSLTGIPDNYIVCNMPATSVTRESRRGERVDYIAEHLARRAAVLVRLLVKQVRSREVSRTELEVLGILKEGPLRITELTELEGVAQPTMTLLVRRLEDKDWVERERLPHDGRVVMVRLTEAGGAAQQRFHAEFLAVVRADLQELSDPQLQALSAATETLSSFVDDLQRRAGR